MAKGGPARELRVRTPDSGEDRFAVTYKVYSNGRLRGAILPILEPEGEERWTALDLEGNTTLWKHRDKARDYLCDLPPRAKPATPEA